MPMRVTTRASERRAHVRTEAEREVWCVLAVGAERVGVVEGASSRVRTRVARDHVPAGFDGDVPVAPLAYTPAGDEEDPWREPQALLDRVRQQVGTASAARARGRVPQDLGGGGCRGAGSVVETARDQVPDQGPGLPRVEAFTVDLECRDAGHDVVPWRVEALRDLVVDVARKSGTRRRSPRPVVPGS